MRRGWPMGMTDECHKQVFRRIEADRWSSGIAICMMEMELWIESIGFREGRRHCIGLIPDRAKDVVTLYPQLPQEWAHVSFATRGGLCDATTE